MPDFGNMRIFRVTDKRGHFLWWEAQDQGVEGAHGVFADFQDGAFLGLTEADKARALTRVARGVSHA